MYRRERTAGLSAGAYLLSKVVVLGLIAFVQAALLVVIGLAFKPLPSHGALLTPLIELMLDVFVLTVASMAMGLAVSACVSSQELATMVVVLLSIGQVMLTGALLTLTSWLRWLSFLAPARWGFAATASTIDFNSIQPPAGGRMDSLWAHKPSAWLLAIGMQIVLTAVFALIAWWGLIRISPGRVSH